MWNSPSVNFYLVRDDISKPEFKKLLLRNEIKRLFDALDILTNILYKSEFYKYFNVLHKVFEWQMKHFYERMNPNLAYIDTMHLEDARTLEINKLITDFDNIKVLLTEIYENRPLAKQSLNGCLLLLDIREDLDEKYEKNLEVFNELNENYQKRYQVLRFEMKRREEKRNRIKEKDTVETLVLDPIYWRHALNSHYIDNDFIEYELKLKTDEFDNKCHYYLAKGTLDTMASNNAHAYLDMEIQQYKVKITHWSWKYEEDFDKATSDVQLLKEHIRVLEKRFSDVKERLNWYRSERERMAMEDAAQEEAERLRIAKEEEALLEKKRKPLKGKKKKKLT